MLTDCGGKCNKIVMGTVMWIILWYLCFMQISNFMWGCATALYTQVSRAEVTTSNVGSSYFFILDSDLEKIAFHDFS